MRPSCRGFIRSVGVLCFFDSAPRKMGVLLRNWEKPYVLSSVSPFGLLLTIHVKSMCLNVPNCSLKLSYTYHTPFNLSYFCLGEESNVFLVQKNYSDLDLCDDLSGHSHDYLKCTLDGNLVILLSFLPWSCQTPPQCGDFPTLTS